MKLKEWSQDIAVALILLILSGIMLLNAMSTMSAEARQFPVLILALFIVLSVALLIKGIKDTRDAAAGKEVNSERLVFEQIKFPLLAFVFITVYVIAVDMIGFIIPSLLFTVGMMWFNYARNKFALILVPVGLVGFLYVLFTFVLASRLP
ncbi:tripartite tricarboxylate transporter TctB family protein [Oscillibacter sp.]|uniref:tripartite tricarboxylate transporter TctB family protein n=1 Tax=Oscillibacter sp. TaxID=1945593 RepID=UPI0028AB155D|nr:tripartite tricarboxylate transporter TctB family protein [Oscillibacter sp.]